MIREIDKDFDICDQMLTKLILDESRYDESIDKNFVCNDYFINVSKNKDNKLYGYYLDNLLIGYIFVKKCENSYLIDGLYILEDYRNNGYASELIQFVLNNFNGDIDINVMCKNEVALNLYKKFGFNEFRLTLRKNN